VTVFGRSRTPSDIVFNLFKCDRLKTISEGGLLLPNTVTLEQFEDYIFQRVFYFYQILSPFNKLKTISEGVLLLPNTVTLEQVEDYIIYSLQIVQG
jgi:hypothetical protein